MLVRSNGRVVRESHTEAAKDLAEGLIRVCFNACGRSLEILVENVKRINIARGEFRSVDIFQKTSSLIKRCNIRATNVSSAISGLNAVVLPAFNLNLGHNILEGQVSSRSLTCKLFNIESTCTKSVVKSLSEKDIGCRWIKILENGKNNRKEHWGNDGWQVIFRGIHPSEQEIVISVGKTFSLLKELNCSSLIELFASFRAQGHMNDIEVGITSPFDPRFKGSLL